MNIVDFSKYKSTLDVGGNSITRLLWYFVNVLFFINKLVPFYGIKRFLLRLFGAKIGKGVVIKPGVNIKYPWNLEIDEYSWIGEDVWIDNHAKVIIGKSVCLSQGSMLLTGNHNYKRSEFEAFVKPIILKHGAWVGTKALVCGGITLHSHSVLSSGSVASKDMEAYTIYRGNPAIKVAERPID